MVCQGHDTSQLTSCDDQDWPRVCIHHWDTRESQKLANSDRLLRQLACVKYHYVEESWQEEQELVGIDIGVCQIPVDVLDARDLRNQTCNVLGEPIRIDQSLYGRRGEGSQVKGVRIHQRLYLSGGDVAKTERLVEVGLLKVCADAEEWSKRAIGGEAAQDDAV